MSMAFLPLSGRYPALGLGTAAVCLTPFVLLVAWTISPDGMLLSGVLFAVGLGLVLRGVLISYPHQRFGAANYVTTLRFALTATVAASLLAPADPAGWTAWAPACLALVGLCLDGLDGWFARRQGLSSAFGARYDMEVDSALAAVLALVLLVREAAGAELLVLGGARYAFVAAGLALPWLNAQLRDSLRRKTVCVIQIGALLALAAPVFPDFAAQPVALGVASLVIWSFALDIQWLARNR